MRTQPPSPSRLARALLRFASSADAAHAAVGDMLEDLECRIATRRAPRWPALWLELQTLKFAIAAVKTRLPRGARAAGHALRDAARALRSRPATALFIVIILAAGIAAATVTFTVVDAVLFRPLLVDPDERLVTVSVRTSVGTTKRSRSLSPEEAQAVRDRVSVADGLATFTVGQASASIDGVQENLNVIATTTEFFRIAGLRTLIGRAWSEDDVAQGGNVAVIGHGFWQRRFNADPGVLGRLVAFVDDRESDRGSRDARRDGPRQIVGVLTAEADAAFDELAWQTQVLVPPSDGLRFFSTFGKSSLTRLRPGVSLASAENEFTAALAPFAPPASSPESAWSVGLSAFRSAFVRVQEVRTWMLMVLGAVGLVVVIACVNAANVMLTRSAGRAHELAVRASLGASRKMLAGTLLAESLMLSAAASACALLVAAGALGSVKSLMPINVPRVSAIDLDHRVFAAAVLAAIVTGLLFGAIPAWEASRASVVGLLKDGSTTATSGRRAWRTVFLVAQVSCVAVLLVLSTLFVGSFIRVATTDLGFDRSNLIAAATVTDYSGTVDDVKARLSRIPGITGVASVTYSSPPLIANAYGGAWGGPTLRAADGEGAASVKTELYRVSSDYFVVAAIPFRRGSTWRTPATADWRPIVIDEDVARALYGDQNPLGRIVQGTNLTGVYTVVGVVPLTLTHGPEGKTMPSVFTAMAPNAKPSWVSFLLRTAGAPGALVRAVETELATISKPNTSAGSGVRVVDDAYRRLTSTRRFTGTLMGLFAMLQMLIGAAGIYAVTSAVVAQRTREFGVRIALGATAGDIHRGVLGRAARHVLLGLAIGLPIAWVLSRGFGALFFKVQPSDASVYFLVSALILGAGLLAAAVPARRAARVDPIVSLRAE
jgi:putative ABC transport system permease protein